MQPYVFSVVRAQMPEDMVSFLEMAEVFRRRAARARRLALATTAPDVAEALREYASRLDGQIRALGEQVAVSSVEREAMKAR